MQLEQINQIQLARLTKKAFTAFLASGLQQYAQHLERTLLVIKVGDALPGDYRILVDDPFVNRIELMELIPLTDQL